MTWSCLFYFDPVHLGAHLYQIIACVARFESGVSICIHLLADNFSALHVEHAYLCANLCSVDLQCATCGSDAECLLLGNCTN